jgi:hypothetical protein
MINTFSYDEARAVHDNEKYEIETDRFLQEQIPDWDNNDGDLLNPNIPDTMATLQVSFYS